MMENALAQKNPDVLSFENQYALVEKALIIGDLAPLKPAERANYYTSICASLGLNALTRPFEYIVQKGSLKLYARKDCTDQLRFIHKVNISIIDRKILDGLCIVTAKAILPNGRTDESIGAVSTIGLKGEDYANALMKAETKAKRRVTLSICGLGVFDESEADTIPDAKPVNVNFQTGEVLESMKSRAESVNDLLSDQATGEVIENANNTENKEPNTDDGKPVIETESVSDPLASKEQLTELKNLWAMQFINDNKAGNAWAKGMLGKAFDTKNLTETEVTMLIAELEKSLTPQEEPIDAEYAEYSGELEMEN